MTFFKLIFGRKMRHSSLITLRKSIKQKYAQCIIDQFKEDGLEAKQKILKAQREQQSFTKKRNDALIILKI